MPTRHEAHPAPLKILSLVRVASALLLGTSAFLAASPANALVNVGAEAGLVKRTADYPANLKLGVGYGVHAELSLLPLIKVGPYYLHYELKSTENSDVGAAFNTIGLRARLMLPVPGSIKPYGYIGAGYTAVGYHSPLVDVSGRFIEIPIGVGAAYEVLPLFQLSLDVAYRPGTSFGGDAWNNNTVGRPSSGYSVLLGAAIDL